MFTFIKKYFGVVVILAVIASGVGAYYYIDNQRVEIADLKKTSGDLKEANDKLTENATKRVDSDKTTDKVVEETKKEEVKVVAAKTQASIYVENKLAEINKKYDEKEKTERNAELRATEISLERAKGMWLAYCLKEPVEQACKWGV